MYIYMYIYIYIYMCVCIYIYVCTQRKQMCNYNTKTCVVSLSPVLTHYTCAIHHRCAPLALVL